MSKQAAEKIGRAILARQQGASLKDAAKSQGLSERQVKAGMAKVGIPRNAR